MSNKGLKLWQESINEFYAKKGETYKVPKKGTQAYIEIKKIYENKKNGVKGPEKKAKKSCKCKCKCDCPK